MRGLGLVLSTVTGVSTLDGYQATTPRGVFAVSDWQKATPCCG